MKKSLSIITIMTGLSLAVFNVALLSPALPSVQNYYDVTSRNAQYIVIAFMIGYSLSQLSFGAICTILGYRKSMFIGIMIGIIGTIFCVFSWYAADYNFMLLGRFIEGFGTSCGLTLCFALANELYEGKAARNVTTYGLMAASILPAFSNYIGGFLVFHLGWISCFELLLICNFIAAFTVFLLPKTLSVRENTKVSISKLIKNYNLAIKNPSIFLGAILYGLFLAIIYLTIETLPFIGIGELHLNVEKFGFLFLLSYLGYFTGTIISRLTTKKISAIQAILFGIIISLLGSSFITINYFTGSLNSLTLFLGIYIIFIGVPLVVINGSNIAISSHKDKANGSSMFNFIYSLFALGAVFLPQFLSGNFEIILPSIIIGLSILGLYMWFKIKKINNTLLN